MRKWFAVAIVALMAAHPALAQTSASPSAPPAAASATASPALLAAVARIVPWLEGEAAPDAVFADVFLRAIPAEQLRALPQQLVAQYGAPVSASVEPASPASGTLTIRFERGTGSGDVVVGADGKIAGLLLRSFAATDDSVARLGQELAALHGATAWGLYRLDATGAPQRIAGANSDAHLAIGSAFKLAVLGTLDAEIAAGRRRWSDVLTLDAKSFPSGTLQTWPTGSPLTLHTLAALMISISDNTATDILIRALGRERIERFAAQHGGASGPNAAPFLTTVEAGVLKSNGALRDRWLAARTAEARRAVLASAPAGSFTVDRVSMEALAGERPGDIDRTEWFASPDNMARLLGWFATRGSSESRAILGISPTVAEVRPGGWRYVGFKGGSETGVISTNVLAQDAAGRWGVLSMHWNDTARAVDNNGFAQMSSRAAELLRAELARTPAR